jgi:energy-coupling factor transporter ATP-binding protein EcfA2
VNSFKITIERKAGTSWPVVVEEEATGASLETRSEGMLELDLLALNAQITPQEYGTMLGQALFREIVHDAFLHARAQSEDCLSVQLFVEAPELHTLRWERLCAPLDGHWQFLLLDQRTPLTLALSSPVDRRFSPIGREDLRALVLVASPQGLERFQLSPFDVATTVSRVRCALGTIPCEVLAATADAVGLPTLDALCERLTRRSYPLLHLVCHGRYSPDLGETVLYLHQDEQQVDPVTASRLLTRLGQLGGEPGLPHFAFLATCESASPRAEGALGGLAQRLVRELGLPAVLAMTEPVSLRTAEVLTGTFYQRLLAHGHLDLALSEACAGVAERPDSTVAALYSRLGARPLFEPRGESITGEGVFLSAAPADAAFAARLTTDLAMRRIVVWTEQSGPAEEQADKQERLRQAIRAAQAVVLVVSSQTRSSRTVRDHLRLADLYQRRLILVRVGEDEHASPPPYGWQETIWVDAHDTQYAAALEAIEANLSQHRSLSELLGPSEAVPEQKPRNPYKGLRAFTANDAGDFFGRDRLADELVKDVEKLLLPEQATTENGRLLTILGPSGSGKSSVVMAGLLPRLQRGALPGSQTWVYLEPMVPGKHPIEALGLTLARHFPERSFTSLREDLSDDATRGLHILAMQLGKQRTSTVVLLVDQFEELFTQTESEEERQRFIDLLLTAVTERRGPLLVLLTLRADFSHYLMQHPELYRLAQAHQKPLLPMEVGDLRAVIEQPAALPDVQLTFEGDLVGDLLFEIQGQVGALPLLQFTLEQLFERRSGHRLTFSAYREIGGIKGALSQHAEQTYAALPSEGHRKLAHALFVRLIDPGASEQDTTRRRAALSEFTLADPTQTRLMRETIDAFITARLLTTNEVGGTTTMEVSHEAVIREWKRLAEWMREARQDILLQQMISEDVAEWERRGKSRDRLYRGSQLKEAQTWAKRNIPSGNEVAFLQASAAQRTLTLMGLIVAVLLLVSSMGLAGGIVGWNSLTHPDPTLVKTSQDGVNGSLRYCIDNAPSGSRITFAPSVRGPIKLTEGDLDVVGDKQLTIDGPRAYQLTISGGKIGAHFHVSKGATLHISYLSFKDSETETNAFLYNEGTLTVTNSIISDNKTTGTVNNIGVVINHAVGGGILNTGTLDVINTIISGNTVRIGYGGGIANFGRLTLNDNSTVSHNTTIGSSNDGSDGGSGGGIANSGTLTLNNSSVSHNTASYSSGGISQDARAPLTLNNSTISDNRALYDAGIGSDGTITLNNSTISDNTASRSNSGGITNYYGGRLTLNNSTISGNTTSSGSGGGISILYGGRLTLNNSTISGNTTSSGSGGGIFISGNGQSSIAQVDITFSTIYGNTAHYGGDILIQDFDSNGTPIKQLSQVRISNSIVAADSAHPGPDIIGMLTSGGYNLFQDHSGASFDPALRSSDKTLSVNDLKIDPVLRDNGGSTAPHTRTHALLPDSPAINAVPLQFCQVPRIWNSRSGIYTDQRGMKRPDENEPACDIGAYEYVDVAT